ncbi:AMP-dependent synthetase/ligase [Agromyces sp. MMS24-K17]|uniref:AMP-dependent synthetase/ligase n=1 Tax=Agromyces sp. MMS24-K17 TaxID=3372850 RepID=UPI003754D7AD
MSDTLDAPPPLPPQPAALDRELAPNVAVHFRRRVERSAGREAFRHPDGGGWRSRTWREVGDDVERVAAGLLALGLASEDRVGIVSETRLEWILADLAVLSAGGATTAVYPTMTGDDAAYILADAACRFVFVEDDAQLDKVLPHRAELPGLERVILIAGAVPGASADLAIPLDDLRALGDALLAERPAAVAEVAEAIRPDQLATLLYTSGTTGRPKGVRLLHRSWVYEGEALASLGFVREDDLNFLWLPMSHSFGKVLLSTQLAAGFTTAIDGRVDRIIDNLAVVQPTFMGAAPRIFEKAYSRIVTTIEGEGGVKAKLFARAFATGRRVEELRRAGRPVPAGLKASHAVLDRLVLRKVRARFGGRVRFFISGSAPLNREIAEWFAAAGIMIIEGYGLTETSAGAAVGHPDHNRFGTVGQALPGSEVRLGDDGELLIRGPHVTEGYQGLPDATAAALDADGWLHTGDQASIDADGYLTITGRLKDLIKTSGGKIIAPEGIEAAFKVILPYTSQVLLFGDGHPYCVALVTLDPDAIVAWAKEQGLPDAPYAELVRSAAADRLVADAFAELNGRLNRWEQVKRWRILDADLSIATGELTPSMKVKRGLVEREHREAIEALYADATSTGSTPSA